MAHQPYGNVVKKREVQQIFTPGPAAQRIQRRNSECDETDPESSVSFDPKTPNSSCIADRVLPPR